MLLVLLWAALQRLARKLYAPGLGMYMWHSLMGSHLGENWPARVTLWLVNLHTMKGFSEWHSCGITDAAKVWIINNFQIFMFSWNVKNGGWADWEARSIERLDLYSRDFSGCCQPSPALFSSSAPHPTCLHCPFLLSCFTPFLWEIAQNKLCTPDKSYHLTYKFNIYMN